MSKHVLFIQGGGNGGYEADAALVASLQKNLSTAYSVHYPKIPDGSEQNFPGQWLEHISRAISSASSDVILAGHSLGASMLLKYLSENKIEKKISGIFLVAPPYWSGSEDWVQPLKLQEGFAHKLPKDIPIFFYQCKDDEVVPFEHFKLYQQNLPRANFREIPHGGHQLNNDLTVVADDIKSL